MIQKLLLKLGKLLFRKPKFRDWCSLEEKKYEVIKAVDENADQFPLLIFQYLSTAFSIHPKDYSKIYWKDAVTAFVEIHNVTVPSKHLPLIYKEFDGKKDAKEPWDYTGRLWFFYSTIIANAFGWAKEKIASLSVDEGLAYVQEILTEKQLDKEFQWSMFEGAYKTDKVTKTSTLINLPRPYFMKRDFTKEPPKTIKIRKDMLPMGLVIKHGEENKTQEVESTRDSDGLLSA